MFRFVALLGLVMAVAACDNHNHLADQAETGKKIREVNAQEVRRGTGLYALVGATLIDGTGKAPVENSCVIIEDEKIISVGERDDVGIPEGASVIDLAGMTLLPGFIDAHYHDEDSDTLTSLYLSNGVTSVRE